MADHRLAWAPRRYTCTAVPRRTHTERPLSALVRVITRSRGAGPPRQAPGGGGGDGELARGGDDAPAGSGDGELARGGDDAPAASGGDAPASGGPAGVPVCCRPHPEITAAVPRATAASTGRLRMAGSFRCLVRRSRVRRRAAGGGSRGPRIVA